MKSVVRGATPGRRLSAPRSRAWLTAAVGVGTLAVSVTALANSRLMQVMTRDLAQLRAGQWWRVITPVLVQPDGWGQLLFNILGIAVVGAALERCTSRGAWTLTYLLGGVGGVVVVSIWQPADHGGGSSDAVAALIGALCVLRATENHRPPGSLPWSDWPAPLYCVFFAGYLTAMDLGGVWWSVLAGNATIVAFTIARRALGAAVFARACLVFVVAAGVAMALQPDGHGVGIVAGAVTASLILLRRQSRGRGRST